MADSHDENLSKAHTSHDENSRNRDEEKRLNLIEGIKRWPRVATYCLALTSVILLWGYDMAASGSLSGLDQFKVDYGMIQDDDAIIASHWLSLWDAAGPIGMLLGSLFGGWLQDKIGRKPSLGLGSVTCVISVLVSWWSQYAAFGNARNGVFMFGRICQGVTCGVIVTTAQTYMSEVLPSPLRGPIIAFFPIFFLLGQLVNAIVVLGVEPIEGPRSYRLAFISQWPFSLLPILLSFVIPESPVWYIRKGKHGLARKAQQRLSTKQDDIDDCLQQIQIVIQHEAEEAKADATTTYLDCFKATNLRRTTLAMFSACLPQLFGLSLIGQGSYFLQIGGMETYPSMVILITGLSLAIVANMVSMYSLTRWGRRTLILWTLAIITVLWIGLGVCGSVENSTSVWALGVIMNLIALIAGLGVWPASYVVAAEISALRVRAKTQGLTWAVSGVINFAISFAIPFIFNTDQGNLRAKIGYMWVGITAITLVGAWFYLPETFRRTPIQLDYMFEQKLSARDFKKWEQPFSFEIEVISPKAEGEDRT